MDKLRLNDVVVRVVAWHNRHPLARRITPDQVHSIGEVVLPFRSRGAWPGQAARPSVAPLEPGLAEGEQAQAEDLSPEGASAEPVEPVEPLEVVDPPAPAWAASAPQPSARSRMVQALRAAWGRWPRPRWPGWSRQKLAPAFSEKFIWPMAPTAVARWAERHAARSTIAPADWPRRVVKTDGLLAHRLETQGLAVALELHLLSAAIGVGDRRIRLLLDARHSIVGPRAYSPARMTGLGSALAGLALATLFGSGALPWPTSESLLAWLPSAHPPTMVVAVVSPPPVHAPDSAAAPIQDEPTSEQLPAASAAATPTEEVAMAASATASAGHAAADAHAGAVSPETPTTKAEPAAEVTASVSAMKAEPAAAVAAPAPAVVTTPPAAVASATGRFALAVRPQLSQDERHAARENGVRLRGQPVPAEPVAAEVRPQAQATPTQDPVYALVTAPTRLRDDSLLLLTRARSLSGQDAALKSARSDLISAQGLWQAALWPFGSRADAERARVRLASKGLKAQVVEF